MPNLESIVISPMATIYEALEYYPERNSELISQFNSRYARIHEIVKEQEMSDKARKLVLEKTRN